MIKITSVASAPPKAAQDLHERWLPEVICMELTSFSSSLGKSVYNINFKTKYCHEVFNIPAFRQDCEKIFRGVAATERLGVLGLGFDRHHTHIVVEAKITDTIPGIVKKLKLVAFHQSI